MRWNTQVNTVRILLLLTCLHVFLVVLSLAGRQHYHLTVLHWGYVHNPEVVFYLLLFVCSDLTSFVLAALGKIFAFRQLVDINGLIGLLLLGSKEVVVHHC